MAGWEGVWTEASMAGGGPSGGLATLARKGLTLGKCSVKNDHRLLKTYVQWTENTKFHIYNIYGYDGGLQGHADLNAELTDKLELLITEAGRIPWLCGGDWNQPPAEQKGHHLRKACIRDHGRGAFQGNKRLDYFISSAAWGPLLTSKVRGTL